MSCIYLISSSFETTLCTGDSKVATKVQVPRCPMGLNMGRMWPVTSHVVHVCLPMYYDIWIPVPLSPIDNRDACCLTVEYVAGGAVSQRGEVEVRRS